MLKSIMLKSVMLKQTMDDKRQHKTLKLEQCKANAL